MHPQAGQEGTWYPCVGDRGRRGVRQLVLFHALGSKSKVQLKWKFCCGILTCDLNLQDLTDEALPKAQATAVMTDIRHVVERVLDYSADVGSDGCDDACDDG